LSIYFYIYIYIYLFFIDHWIEIGSINREINNIQSFYMVNVFIFTELLH